MSFLDGYSSSSLESNIRSIQRPPESIYPAISL